MRGVHLFLVLVEEADLVNDSPGIVLAMPYRITRLAVYRCAILTPIGSFDFVAFIVIFDAPAGVAVLV